jgi:hypothetical protein
MRTSRCRRCAGSSGGASLRRARLLSLVLAACSLLTSVGASAQTLSQRGFIEANLFAFAERAPNDATRAVGDLLVRDDAFFTPIPWLQFAGGVDVRANTHDQVDGWSVDAADRRVRRPRVALRRAAATFARGPLTIDAGKQFIRWGTADIVNPTDRFAPRDFLNVLDSDFLGVTGVRGVLQLASHTIDIVWTPRMTPGRVPLLDQRWTVVPAEARQLPLRDATGSLPSGSQTGVRWGHTIGGLEYSLSFFDGFNHMPDVRASVAFDPTLAVPVAIDVARVYPPIRSYGGDMSLPTRWATIKAEAAYFTSASTVSDEYGLYVVQLERQSGEWLFVGGYAGEVVTTRRSAATFAPDRGTSRAILGRASHTIDVNRSVAFEAAVRQNGRGAYGKVEYSQARGQHWRFTATAVALGGESDDFFGQYRRNSHLLLSARYSF